MHRFKPGYVGRLKFSPDSKLLLLQDHLWDVVGGKLLPWSFDANETVTAAGFSPDGTVLAASYADFNPFGSPLFAPSIRFWDTASGKMIRQFKGARGYTMVAFSPDGKSLAVTSAAESAVRLL